MSLATYSSKKMALLSTILTNESHYEWAYIWSKSVQSHWAITDYFSLAVTAEMVQADLEDKLVNYLKKIARLDVLDIDNFLLTPTTQDEQNYLMEIFGLRSRNQFLIISSQMETGEWHKN